MCTVFRQSRKRFMFFVQVYEERERDRERENKRNVKIWK